jgi:hypothetical protein
MAPPSRSDGAARASAALDRSGPTAEARDQRPGESVSVTRRAVQPPSPRAAVGRCSAGGRKVAVQIQSPRPHETAAKPRRFRFLARGARPVTGSMWSPSRSENARRRPRRRGSRQALASRATCRGAGVAGSKPVAHPEATPANLIRVTKPRDRFTPRCRAALPYRNGICCAPWPFAVAGSSLPSRRSVSNARWRFAIVRGALSRIPSSSSMRARR